MSDTPIVDLWHGDRHLAMRHRGPVVAGDVLYARNLIFLDGRTPRDGDVAVCGTCHLAMWVEDMRLAPAWA